MSAERKSFIEKAAEFSKKLDYITIAIGGGIFILGNATVGAVLVIGSALTIIPADMIARRAKRKRQD